MNADQFEEKLCSQPIRKAPSEWRKEILGAANRQRPTHAIKSGEQSPEFAWLHDLLWPSPVAWGALACLWLVALLPGANTHEQTAPKASQVSATEQRLVREQREFMSREFGAAALPTAWRPHRTQPAGSEGANPETNGTLPTQRWSMSVSEGELA